MNKDYMNKEYIVWQLAETAKRFHIELSQEILGEIIRHIGDEAKTAGMVPDGLLRCYYVDSDGNEFTRGFSV